MGARLGAKVMDMKLLSRNSFEDAVSQAVQRLASVRHEADGSFVSTSNMYPSGGAVAVWIRRDEPHFYVSDYGYAYRECAIMGADRRQFVKRAGPIAEAAGVRLSADGEFEVIVSEGQLAGAIKTIAACAQETAIKFAHRIHQRQRADVGALVFGKLERLFGDRFVAKDHDFLGASHSHWRIDVIVTRDDQIALFDTVTPWAQSVAFTLAKFGDIRLLENAPQRTAVLSSKTGYGSWMTALAQNASIIQAAANDDAYIRASAIR